MLVTLKGIYNGEIRRFRHVPASFAGISSTIANGFDLDADTILIRYCDDDRDLCTLTPRTVSDALTFLELNDHVLRVYVTQKYPCPPPSLAPALSHAGIVCDGCESEPLLGARFKCRVCDNFDLCSLCYRSSDLEVVDHVCRHSFDEIDASSVKDDEEFPWVTVTGCD
jgi:hypothetical protein